MWIYIHSDKNVNEMIKKVYDFVKSREGIVTIIRRELLDHVCEKRQQPFVGQEPEYFSCAGLHADASGTELELSRVLCAQMDSSGRVQAGVAAGVQEEGRRQGAGGFL